MPRAKVYAIIYDDDNVYVPIKAFFSPYNDTRAYCASMPAFFGGTFDYTYAGDLVACRNTALESEIDEESQHKYQLTVGFTTEGNPNVRRLNLGAAARTDYHFYAIRSAALTTDAVFQHHVCALDPNVAEPEEREHCCIIQVPRTAITAQVEVPRINAFMHFCKRAGYCKCKCADDEFIESETIKAFRAFFTIWPAD